MELDAHISSLSLVFKSAKLPSARLFLLVRGGASASGIRVEGELSRWRLESALA